MARSSRTGQSSHEWLLWLGSAYYYVTYRPEQAFTGVKGDALVDVAGGRSKAP